jgi:chromosome segregation ATPase
MGSIPNAPQQEQQYEAYEVAPTPRWIPILFGVLVLGVGWLAYSGYSTRKGLEAELVEATKSMDLLSKQLEQANDQIAELRGQFEVTSEKLGVTQGELDRARQLAAAIRKEQREKDTELLAKIGEVEQDSAAKLGAVSTDVAGAKTDIEATRKDLEATKAGLQRVVGDAGVMSGLIATNREELEALKRRGERNYYDFDLKKSKKLERIGPIQIRLNKVDVKRSKYTLTVYADDRSIEKKDKTVNEPVQFYPAGAKSRGSLYELVVYEVQKDRAIGYLSAPKELAQRQ